MTMPKVVYRDSSRRSIRDETIRLFLFFFFFFKRNRSYCALSAGQVERDHADIFKDFVKEAS